MNCMSNVMEPGQTFNVKKKTGEGSRDVDKEVIATIKKNPTYLPALADKLYCLKQPIEVRSRVFFCLSHGSFQHNCATTTISNLACPTQVWDASGSRIGAFMYPSRCLFLPFQL